MTSATLPASEPFSHEMTQPAFPSAWLHPHKASSSPARISALDASGAQGWAWTEAPAPAPQASATLRGSPLKLSAPPPQDPPHDTAPRVFCSAPWNSHTVKKSPASSDLGLLGDRPPWTGPAHLPRMQIAEVQPKQNSPPLPWQLLASSLLLSPHRQEALTPGARVCFMQSPAIV